MRATIRYAERVCWNPLLVRRRFVDLLLVASCAC
jgi:hypothetical protein